MIVVADGSCGDACSVLGISSEYIVESCHAYGANATIERLDQRQVSPTDLYLFTDGGYQGGVEAHQPGSGLDTNTKDFCRMF